MLVSYERFNDTPIMSLQTGSELARTSKAIIDPRNLTIVAYELEGRTLTQQPSLLLVRDVREVGPLGIIIDSTDELVSPNDVVKVEEVYNFNFELIGVKVVDDRGRHVGKVNGYSVDMSSFVIQQINVKRPFFQSLNDTELLVHRSQIIKVSDNKIMIHSPTVRKDKAEAKVSPTFNNPFRKTASSQPESIDS